MSISELGMGTEPTKTKNVSKAKRPARDRLEESILSLALKTGPDVAAVDKHLATLSRTHGDEVYARFIHLISHLDFPAVEARKHWEAVVQHTTSLSSLLKRRVDFRVGLADYFVFKNPKITHPKVIDLYLFNETEAGNLKDALTGLYNYRYIQDTLPREISTARRLGSPLSLIFLDVDFFKAYNDQFGHSAGNEALVAIAGVIRGSIRDMDLPCRYGGEEFVVILPATDKFGAMSVGERIVRLIEHMKLPSPSPQGVLTVSAGVASFPVDAADSAALVEAADAAMYQAKAWGKNRAVPFSTERRGANRQDREFLGDCTVSMRTTFPVLGRNLSQNGLFFVAPTEMAPGHNVDLVLKLPLEEGKNQVICKARITRCEILGQEGYGIGAAITYIPPWDRLRFFQALEGQRPD